jgi:branched-chain amino acid transport system permease protein
MLIQLLINGLIAGALYALVALGFSLIYRSTKIFHIAHAATYTASAYLLYLFYNQMEIPLIIAAILAVFLAGCLGVLMEFLVYHPLHRDEAASSVMLISSIGMMTVIINLIAMIWGNETKTIITGIAKTISFQNPLAEPGSSFKNLILSLPQLYQLLVALVIITLTLFFLENSKSGKRIGAICDNSRLVEIFGISLKKHRLLIFFLGSSLAAIASVLTSIDIGMDPFVGMPVLLIAAVAVITGGSEKFAGAVLGGFLLGFLKAIVIWKMSAKWESLVIFVLLVIFLLFRPHGILGQSRRNI